MSEELKALLSCQVCKELCKRGVSVKCCNARACRACATKEVTAKRLCWNPDCRSPVANTEDLVNDDLLRSAVGLFKQKNTLPNDVAAKVKATFGTKPSQQNQQQTATATKSAPKTAVTPTTPKPAVAPTTPKPAVAATTPKTTAKPATPIKGTTPAIPKKGATPATPKAAALPVAPKPVFSLKAPYTPKLAAAVKASPNAAASPKSAAVAPLAGQKRKSDLAGNGKVETADPKKIAPEFEYKYVIMDMQIVMSGHRNGFVHQMALLHKPNNGPPQQVFIPVADPNVPFIRRLPESHRQAIGSRDSKENSYKLVFMRKGKEETYVQGLDPAYGRLSQFCTSLKSSDRTKIVVVVYSDRMFNIMNKFFFKPHDFRQALEYCFDEVLTLSPLNHKFNTVFDEVPVHEVLGVDKGADCSESVQLISSVFQRLSKIDRQSNLKSPKDNKFRKYPSLGKKPSNDHLLIVYSCQVELQKGWFVPKEPEKLTKGSAATKKAVAATPKKDECIVLDDDDVTMKSAIKKTADMKSANKKTADKEDEEIVIVSEPILAENPFPSGIYPIFTQPILVKFNNLPSTSKVVNFLSSTALGCKSTNFSKVSYHNQNAYGFFFHTPKLSLKDRFKTTSAEMIKLVAANTNFGEVQVNNSKNFCEESRNLKKITKVDLVFAADPNEGNKTTQTFVITKKPAVILVRLKSQDQTGQISFTIRDVFLFIKSRLKGVSVVTHLFCPERKGNLAKVVFALTPTEDGDKEDKEGVTISTGEILGTALLFQGENLPLLLGRADQHGEISTKLYNSEEIIALDTVPGKVMSSNEASKVMPGSLKQPCNTFRAQCIYSKFNNQILVKLVRSTPIKEKNAFGAAKIQLNQEFLKLISTDNPNSLPNSVKEPFVLPVMWFDNEPYTVLSINPTLNPTQNSGGIGAKMIKSSLAIATYTPVESQEGPENPPNLEMTVCVDFNEKDRYVDQKPVLVKAYLKFIAGTIPKKDVLKQVFAVSQVLNTKLSVLTIMFKPDQTSKLAPEKTQTNDMKCELIVYCSEGSVTLQPREVFANVVTMGRPKNPLVLFKKCGAEVELPDPDLDQEMQEYGNQVDYEYEDMEERQNREKRERFENMRARARAFQAGQQPDTRSWEDDEPYNKRSRYPQNDSRGGGAHDSRGGAAYDSRGGVAHDSRGGGAHDSRGGGGHDDRSFDRRRHQDEPSFRGRDPPASGGMEARYQQSLGQADQPWTGQRPPPFGAAASIIPGFAAQPPRLPEPQQTSASRDNTWAQEAERFINRSQQGMNIPLLPGASRQQGMNVPLLPGATRNTPARPLMEQKGSFGRPLRDEKQDFGRPPVGLEEPFRRPMIDRADRAPEDQSKRPVGVRADFGRQIPSQGINNPWEKELHKPSARDEYMRDKRINEQGGSQRDSHPRREEIQREHTGPRDTIPRGSLPRDNVPSASLKHENMNKIREDKSKEYISRYIMQNASNPREEMQRASNSREEMQRASNPREEMQRASNPRDSIGYETAMKRVAHSEKELTREEFIQKMREEKSRSSQPQDTMQRGIHSRDRMQRDEIDTMQRGIHSRDRMQRDEIDIMQRGIHSRDRMQRDEIDTMQREIHSRDRMMQREPSPQREKRFRKDDEIVEIVSEWPPQKVASNSRSENPETNPMMGSMRGNLMSSAKDMLAKLESQEAAIIKQQQDLEVRRFNQGGNPPPSAQFGRNLPYGGGGNGMNLPHGRGGNGMNLPHGGSGNRVPPPQAQFGRQFAQFEDWYNH